MKKKLIFSLGITAIVLTTLGFKEYDIIPGIDPTGKTNVTGAILYQLVGNAVINTNKGLIISSDTKPNVTDNPRYTNYLWFDKTTITLKFYQGTGDSVTNWHPVIGVSTITSANITDYSIQSVDLGTNAVQEYAIAAGAVTSTKINDGQIVLGKIGPLAVTNGNIAHGAVTYDKISSETIQTTNIADGAITADKLAADSILGSSLTNNSVTEAKIANNAIINRHLNADIIRETNIINQAVTSNKIANATIHTVNLNTNIANGLARAWGVVDGSGNLLRGFNIASAVRTSTGNYTATFAPTFTPSTVNYCVTATANTNDLAQGLIVTVKTNTTALIAFEVTNVNDAGVTKNAIIYFQVLDF